MHLLPREINSKAPPLKTQGIKTKLVPLIARSISWHGQGRWVEPFLGSGVVALNIRPRRAILADTNAHVIALYRQIQDGTLTGYTARAHLEREGRTLLSKGEGHYYAVRERFNHTGNPLDFLFLSRSCFNGMMRFNRKGHFNVPFCRKPERFRPALITRIVNQVEWARLAMRGRDWTFLVQDWRLTVDDARADDFIYCDPPYVGRHTDYYNGFTESESDSLAEALIATPAAFALSMWLENKYRRNHYVDRWFADFPRRTASHFYHVGPSESLRNGMTEALILSRHAAAPKPASPSRTTPSQVSLLSAAEPPKSVEV